ncbi:hypothetical protein Tco_0841308 [Tanacetum coccineum]|uniref:Uncharacterized protein n=1 Tax=Tanacetum coccineum TaxID=301880 RepID=A0ABQ5AW24_9ASTR
MLKTHPWPSDSNLVLSFGQSQPSKSLEGWVAGYCKLLAINYGEVSVIVEVGGDVLPKVLLGDAQFLNALSILAGDLRVLVCYGRDDVYHRIGTLSLIYPVASVAGTLFFAVPGLIGTHLVAKSDT